ncbi:Uncharacterised protein [Mycobacteroides abscessus subsp. massiliense]|nr:Uncharacterised protein [Mycobacteroides abscessus subsp. massiliense]SLB37581.1 Uncharacterised protein [Mycobacteroides abscessus subsp. massiliense]SLE33737.1 Uncharacterised protein [Mycobacteroides abscessus subsp. massiliense]
MLQRAQVQLGPDAQLFDEIQQAFLLAAECGAARARRHEERLNAERIAGAEQLAFRGVPDREREHAA